MNQRAGKGCCDNLIGTGADGDGWRYVVQNQKWGHQKSATDTEHARQESNRSADREQREQIDGELRYRKVDTQYSNPKVDREASCLLSQSELCV